MIGTETCERGLMINQLKESLLSKPFHRDSQVSIATLIKTVWTSTLSISFEKLESNVNSHILISIL